MLFAPLEAGAQADLSGIARSVHSFGPSCHYLGATRLAVLCQEIEKGALAGKAAIVKSLWPTFQAEARRVLEALAKEKRRRVEEGVGQ